MIASRGLSTTGNAPTPDQPKAKRDRRASRDPANTKYVQVRLNPEQYRRLAIVTMHRRDNINGFVRNAIVEAVETCYAAISNKTLEELARV